MVSVLDSGFSGLGLSPGTQGHCVRKTLYSHSASLHPGIPCDGLPSHPGESLNTPTAVVASCWNKLWPDEPLQTLPLPNKCFFYACTISGMELNIKSSFV